MESIPAMRKYISVTLFILCLGNLRTNAQNCTANLGNPLVNITFGAGPNFGPPLAPGITNMSYVPNTFPQDGQYSIVSNTVYGSSATWHSLPGDHTGDLNGYFMLINASYQPSDFYVRTVSGFCQGTTYQFGAWIMNMMQINNGYIQPNITFRIEKTDGTVLGSYTTGNIPVTIPAAWTQCSFYFTIPVGISTIVLRMTNNAPGGNGNDLALDDITFRPAGPAITIQNSAFAGQAGTVCTGSSFSFSSQVNNCYPSTAYQWQLSLDNGTTWANIPGAGGPNFPTSPGVAGTYLYRLAVAQSGNLGSGYCSVFSNPITVVAQDGPVPGITITPSANPTCPGTSVTLTAAATNGGSAPVYQWQVNGKNIAATGSTFTSSTLSNNDIITCTLTSNAPCANPATVTSNAITLSVIPIPTPSISITPSANPTCTGAPVTLTTSITNGGSAPSYQWQVNGKDIAATGTTFTSSTLNNNDIITCILTSNAPCASPATAVSNTVTLTVNPLPVIAPGQIFYMYGGQPVTLTPVISGSIARFLWTPAAGLSGNTIRDPIASLPVSTLYTLKVQTTDGCQSSSIIKVEPVQKLGIPNAFTPNGDGNNDVFYVLGGPPGARVKDLAVFNRWGGQVFQVRDAVPGDRRFGWNGSYKGLPAPTGTYVYMIIVEFADATQQKFSGTVILLR
jgi:gliding motility-associated-like protein